MTPTERKLLKDLNMALISWWRLYALRDSQCMRKYIAGLRQRIKRALEPGKIAR